MPLPNHAELFFGLGPKLTEEQRIYLDSIFDNQFTIVNARSGSGKTTVAVGAAKILGKPLHYIFSPVEEGKMGFRPGTQAEKEEAYRQPLIDALLEIGENPAKVVFNEENMDALKSGSVWVYPRSHVFERGTNIKDVTLIIDEAQNYTRGELKKVLTRVHPTTTVIMIGHDGQCDLPNPSKSGFVPFLEWFADEPYANVVNLTRNFRGPLAQHADNLTW